MSTAIQSLWQHQEPNARDLRLAEIRRRADQALAEDRQFYRTGLISAGLLIVTFGATAALNAEPTFRVGAGIGIAAGFSVAVRARRLRATHPLLPSGAGIESYRRILEREQAALGICWQTMLLVQLAVLVQVLSESGPPGRRARQLYDPR